MELDETELFVEFLPFTLLKVVFVLRLPIVAKDQLLRELSGQISLPRPGRTGQDEIVIVP